MVPNRVTHQIYTKIEFQNSIVKFSFLYRMTDIKITWINPCIFPKWHDLPEIFQELLLAVVYSEPCQTCFQNPVFRTSSSFQLLTDFTKNSILDVWWQGSSEYASGKCSKVSLSISETLFTNPCHVTRLSLYLLKTLRNHWFSDVFRGYRKRLVAWDGLV